MKNCYCLVSIKVSQLFNNILQAIDKHIKYQVTKDRSLRNTRERSEGCRVNVMISNQMKTSNKSPNNL